MTGYRYYEFFAGAGLVRLALEPDWVCAWANDIDAKKAEVYRANFGRDHFVLGDVADVTADTLPTRADMAWASFPCQDLSLAGWLRGMSAERSGTFWAFWRIMRDLFDKGDRPPVIVIENVAGLLYGDNFIGLCEALAALGMQFGPLLIDARWFLPQSRPRVFIVAVDCSVDCSGLVQNWPQSTPWFTPAVWAARASLPSNLVQSWRWWKLPRPEARVTRLEELTEVDPSIEDWHGVDATQRLLSLMSPVNLAKVEQARLRGERSVGFLYKRTREAGQRAEVRFDGVAGCLRTPRGGSSRQTVLVVENGTVRSRLLTAREAARLMGVPDTFKLPSSYNDAYLAMGDGVAVPVVAWLEEHLLRPLADLCRSNHEVRGGAVSPETDSTVAGLRRATEARAEQWDKTERHAGTVSPKIPGRAGSMV